jgi:hypothetical protein
MHREGGRSSPNRLLDDTSPEQLLELIPESLGLEKWPPDMGDHCAKVEVKAMKPTVKSLRGYLDGCTLQQDRLYFSQFPCISCHKYCTRD